MTPRTVARQAPLFSIISQSLLKFTSVELVMLSNHLILCRSLLHLLSIFPSIRVFSNDSALCIQWPKYWSFSFSISPFNEYLGLISFKIDWFDLFVVQGTLKSLLQHHSLKASILRCSAVFMVQLIIALQCCVNLCYATKCISYMYTHIPPGLSFRTTGLPCLCNFPTPLGHHRALSYTAASH